MKWKVRRMVEKCMLFLVGIKPIRWFIDQLFKLGEWAGKKPWLHTIWRWYGKLFKPFWYSYLIYSLIFDAWNRNAWNCLIDIACILLVFAIDDRHGPDNDNEDEPDDPDPTPNGDAVDMWIREQQKTLV